MLPPGPTASAVTAESDSGANAPAAIPAGPDTWPPTARWPAALHTAIAELNRQMAALADPGAGPAAEADRAASDALPLLLLGVSGGADSLALAVAAAEAARTSSSGHHVARSGRRPSFNGQKAASKRSFWSLNDGPGPYDEVSAPLDAAPDATPPTSARTSASPLGSWRVGAVVVDHQLQSGSAHVAEHTAAVLRTIGLDPVIVTPVTVPAGSGRGGLEASARTARYRAFTDAIRTTGALAVATAHTADDQAEQVLLGITRGSGLRSLAGIRPVRTLSDESAQPVQSVPTIGESAVLLRPLLSLTRADTEQICRWAGLTWWQDPMNADESSLRVRVRHRLLPALTDPETGLGTGVKTGLVTTAQLAAEDADALDAWTNQLYTDIRETLTAPERSRILLALDPLHEAPGAIRRRVIAAAVRDLGAPQPSAERLAAVEELITNAHSGGGSAGPVQLPGGVEVYRRIRHSDGGTTVEAAEYAKLELFRPPRQEPTR